MNKKQAVLAGGCFWGLEDLIRRQPGVIDTEVGYVGGDNDYPTYENHPDHAEAVHIAYDADTTSYKQLLDFFFQVHDPTMLNRQGNDVGSSYRSAIFYGNDEEKRIAEEMIDLVNRSGRWPRPVVTTLQPLTVFYPAEDYHQDYLVKNPGGYTCHFQRGGSYLSEGK
ncbi:peptide-methionine (S)-S-oxide reductase MsrA [Candidatus Uhrbacteria bacterium]|nr:peptide-methionine (S)-S-oxide reductase MsrA [Candidatus Uhrbacteria bacterium]